jgi:hypothetical protein
VRDFLQEACEGRRKFIKHISFALIGKPAELAMAAELLYQCNGLRSIEIKQSNSYRSIQLSPKGLGGKSMTTLALTGLRGLKEVTVRPVRASRRHITLGHRQFEEKWDREQTANAKCMEQILKEHICRERAEGDRLSSEGLAEMQAQKVEDREELMKQNAEWQNRKVTRAHNGKHGAS